ncbi:MAG: hypothetical protein IH606_22860 [Burkholderiales bacterium]|nr:hypothetical protein [Burkholderiales bacterium]
MIRLVVALAVAWSCSPALAQKKMYRCGNQYQERPCEGPKADPAASSTATADPQSQDAAAKRKAREQEMHRARCEGYAEELADVDRRIEAGAGREAMDQFKLRRNEMRLRIERDCK